MLAKTYHSPSLCLTSSKQNLLEKNLRTESIKFFKSIISNFKLTPNSAWWCVRATLSWLLWFHSEFWNQKVWVSNSVSHFQKCFNYSGSLAFPYQFYVQCINFCKNQLKLHRDWVESVDPFGEYCHLNILRFIITSVFATPLSLVQNCYPLGHLVV